MKTVAILCSEYVSLVDVFKHELSEYSVEWVKDIEDNAAYDVVVCLDKETEYKGRYISSHYSLLPAFDCDEPLKCAFEYGAKVTGISFYYSNPNIILAQYPVFITPEMHLDDLQNQIIYVEQIIFPRIVRSILNNEQFDVREFTNNKKQCSGSCGECSGCCH